jgi:hypothetical protein
MSYELSQSQLALDSGGRNHAPSADPTLMKPELFPKFFLPSTPAYVFH